MTDEHCVDCGLHVFECQCTSDCLECGRACPDCTCARDTDVDLVRPGLDRVQRDERMAGA